MNYLTLIFNRSKGKRGFFKLTQVEKERRVKNKEDARKRRKFKKVKRIEERMKLLNKRLEDARK